MLSDQLQSEDIDMSKAVQLASATVETLSELRGEERQGQVVQYTNQVAAVNNLSINSSNCPECTKSVPQRFQDDIILETTGVKEDTTCYDQLKTSIYLPVIDCMLSEMNQ